MALDLHLECPVTLRVRDRRRNPLRRQQRVDEEEKQAQDSSRKSSHSLSPRLPSKETEVTTIMKGKDFSTSYIQKNFYVAFMFFGLQEVLCINFHTTHREEEAQTHPTVLAEPEQEEESAIIPEENWKEPLVPTPD